MKHLSTVALTLALCAASVAAMAQTATPAKPAKKATKPVAAAKAPAEPEAASPAQLAAAERVYYGTYACEFDKTVQVSTLPKYPGYAELRFGKSVYVMKPVESTTGAIRLEDVKGETLVVQIAAKSMLLNVKTGQRLLDGCVSEKQGKVAAAVS
jgi:hypothetical protein